MRFTFQFFKGVELDIAKAKLWYKEQKPGLEEILTVKLERQLILNRYPSILSAGPLGRSKQGHLLHLLFLRYFSQQRVFNCKGSSKGTGWVGSTRDSALSE